MEQARFERRARLFADGLSTRTEFEANQLKVQQANAKLVEARQKLDNARLEVRSVEAEYGEKIAKARSDRDATRSEIGEAQSEVAKLRSQHASMQIRNEMYHIDAPQDGYIVQALKTGVGETVKEGEALLTIAPARPEQAVVLYVKAMDVPLLKPGRKVRLLFDGWPALQFSGWPSVSVGTFGGVIKVIDAVEGGQGKFRVLVIPDSTEQPWPAQVQDGIRGARMGHAGHGAGLVRDLAAAQRLPAQYSRRGRPGRAVSGGRSRSRDAPAASAFSRPSWCRTRPGAADAAGLAAGLHQRAHVRRVLRRGAGRPPGRAPGPAAG